MNTKVRPRTYQKKISLHPLKFEEAVSALLKVKPKPKSEKSKKQ